MINISILQEYEKIKEIIGENKWNNIDKYIKENKSLTFDELIYNMFNWIKFDKWYYKEIKKQEVEILGVWNTDYGDIAYQAILYKNGKKVANIMDSDEETTLRYVYGDSYSELTEELIKASIISIINDKFDSYLALPKISKCSTLLQKVYYYVCESEASMCHVDQEEWLNWKETNNFKEEDITILAKEIKKHNLEDVISINDNGYIIVGYGNLQYMFNDDKNLEKEDSYEL